MFVSDVQEQERPQLSGAVGNPTSHLAQWVLKQCNEVSVLRTLVCLVGLRGGVVNTLTRVGGQPAANITCGSWRERTVPMLTRLLCGQTLRNTSRPVGASFALNTVAC